MSVRRPSLTRELAIVLVVKIAVTSQNRRNITDHTGKCRKSWV